MISPIERLADFAERVDGVLVVLRYPAPSSARAPWSVAVHFGGNAALDVLSCRYDAATLEDAAAAVCEEIGE